MRSIIRQKFPDPADIKQVEEPIIDATDDHSAKNIRRDSEAAEKRSVACRKVRVHRQRRVMLTYEMPLNEIVLDFYDRLKSARAAMLRSTIICPVIAKSTLVKLDVLVAGEPVDALSMMCIAISPTNAARHSWNGCVS